MQIQCVWEYFKRCFLFSIYLLFWFTTPSSFHCFLSSFFLLFLSVSVHYSDLLHLPFSVVPFFSFSCLLFLFTSSSFFCCCLSFLFLFTILIQVIFFLFLSFFLVFLAFLSYFLLFLSLLPFNVSTVIITFLNFLFSKYFDISVNLFQSI